MVLVQAHLRLLARYGYETGSRSPDILVVSVSVPVPVPVPVSVPAFPCFPVALVALALHFLAGKSLRTVVRHM